MTASTIQWVIGQAIVLIGMVIGGYIALTREIAAVDSGLKERLAKVETQVAVFWKDVSFDAARILHSPDPAHWQMDRLIERFEAEEITREELKEFIERLERIRADHDALKGERLAASLILRAIERRYEFQEMEN